MNKQKSLVLITGATGYIGGRLAPRLIGDGYRVRCLVRDRSRLQGRPWVDKAEVFQGDIFDPDSLLPALQGVQAAYYLVHSMASGHDFGERDQIAARNFSRAAKVCGVEQIIYLGGLGDPESMLSPHLRSRQQTGDSLREENVPVTEFRAGVIVGSGSLSFEMIRYLTERVPVMICPRWVFTRIQPLAIQDVLDYLVSALRNPQCRGKIIEIGGADVITYSEMMMGYARVRGLKRWMIPVPVLTPRLSSYWVHLVTPIPASIAQPLIEGLKNEVIVRDDTAATLFPEIKPIHYQEAVSLALGKLQAAELETVWCDALITSQGDLKPVVLSTQEGMILEKRQLNLALPAEVIFRSFTSLGGHRGWLYMNWAWRLRGAMDWMVGGVGLRRGRRDPDHLRVGDAVDFWRVEEIEDGAMLRLRAEMKVPGRAWLQFQVQAFSDQACLLTQTAFFAPKGLSGFLYWYLLYPIHSLIFSGMIRKIAERATRMTMEKTK